MLTGMSLWMVFTQTVVSLKSKYFSPIGLQDRRNLASIVTDAFNEAEAKVPLWVMAAAAVSENSWDSDVHTG